jgi:hypothetical protein
MTSAESLNHAKPAGELRAALGTRPDAASAEKALRELITVKGDIEYGTTLIALTKTEPFVRRAQTLVDLAKQIVRPGH